MRKVMIVDDESLVRIGLQSMIDWESRGYTIAGVYKNGEDALQAAKLQYFDIVLTDIRMPGMSGLELVEQLQVESPHTSIIILSSYNDFEYTRKAIQLGVKDYISKYELEPEELFKVLDSISPVPADRSLPDLSASAAPLAIELEQFLQQSRMSNESTLPHPLDQEGMEYPLLDNLISQTGNPLARWISIRPKEWRTDAGSRGEASDDWRVLRLLLEEEFDATNHFIFLGYDHDCLHGLMTLSDVDNKSILHELSTKWVATCLEKLNLAITIFWSSPFSINPVTSATVASHRVAALHLEQLLFFSPDASYLIAEQQPTLRKFSHEEWLDCHQLIRKRITLCQFSNLEKDLAEWLARYPTIAPAEWLRLYQLAAGQIADYLLQECRLSSREAAQYFAGVWPFSEAFTDVSTKARLTTRFAQIIESTEKYMYAGTHSAAWIAQVKEYVEEHYATAPRLEDAAMHVHLSVNYFSQKFRQDTGEGFNDYLTKVRIQEAVKLMRSTNLSTEEIAIRIGYMNTNYFVKVFKKVTGQTIKEFKSQVNKA